MIKLLLASYFCQTYKKKKILNISNPGIKCNKLHEWKSVTDQINSENSVNCLILSF